MPSSPSAAGVEVDSSPVPGKRTRCCRFNSNIASGLIGVRSTPFPATFFIFLMKKTHGLLVSSIPDHLPVFADTIGNIGHDRL